MLDEAQKTERKATSKSNLWRSITALALVAVLTLLAAPVVSNIGRFNLPAWALLATFMEKMAQNDFENAYALYSPQAKEQRALSDLEAMTHESSFDLFEGYKGLLVRDFHLQAAYDPKLPDFMADVEGTIFYKGKSSHPFTAALVMIDDRWVIESIQIDSLPSQP